MGTFFSVASLKYICYPFKNLQKNEPTEDTVWSKILESQDVSGIHVQL